MSNFIAATAAAGYPRPSLLPPREAALGLHHPSDILGRGGPGYADQLAHQVQPFNSTAVCKY
jgi:arginine-glutamic acid dipeptide repeat-containing protein